MINVTEVTGKHAILVVEDDEVIRALLQDYLEDAGFSVFGAANAEEARRVIASRETIELVLTDINMPGSMDGADLARWLGQFAPELPVILVSGKETFPESNAAKRWFLRKPFELKAVEQQIKSIFDSED